MKLAELQSYFAKAATSGSGPLADLDRVFLSTERLAAVDRLAIYNRGYFLRLLDALGSVYGSTKRLLGEANFERLGLDYVAQHPSEHPAVERVGRSFSAHLRGALAPTAIVDLAALEWARLCALVAPEPASIATLTSIDPERFARGRFHFVPSLHCLQVDPRALLALAESDLSSVELREASPRPPLGVAVWRDGHVVRHQALEAAEWNALSSAVSGARSNQVCTAFDSGSAEADVQLAFQVLSGWFARRWLVSVSYDSGSGSK